MRTLTLAALCTAALAALLPAAAAAAPSGPFEPNDSIVRAAGPLASGTPIHAEIETVGDPDWYFLVTNAPGPVQVSLTLATCGPAVTGPTCNNVSITAYDGEGAIAARGIVNRVGETLVLSFEGRAAGRVSIEVRSTGAVGAAYDLVATFPSDAQPPQDVPPVRYPDVIPEFETRFEMTYTGSARHPRNRQIAGLVVRKVQPGSTIIVRCIRGCAKRYTKTVMARGTTRRLGGLPLRLRPNTRLHIEVRREGFVGRWKIYRFTRGIPRPRTRAKGCASPYDFQPIPCAPGA